MENKSLGDQVMLYEFATKVNNRKNSAGIIIEKTRVWLEESTNNRFLSDAGFTRGTPVYIFTHDDQITIIVNTSIHIERHRRLAKTEGKRAKVAGKADRSLFDITRNRDQMPEAFHPENNARLVAIVESGFITITTK